MAKPFKTRFKCKDCGEPLYKIPYHNEYFCQGCWKRFTLPYDKARQENFRTYQMKGRIMQRGVIDHNGDVWYR